MEHKLEKRFPANRKDYKLYEEVGEGVSATVYRALCIPLNEIVAIKVLDFEKCNNDLDGIRREVQTMSLIDHPNLLHAYCSFTAGHNLWVVMPYMAGGSALHIMKSAFPEGFEEPVIATLLREVLKALVYLHSHGHIHRDVKAGNILIDKNGVVKLADFGVSACMFDTGDRQRSRNTFVGTPCWMAPEVMQQLHGYDFKADIWSFGITALELAHGHAPFSKYPPMKVLLMTLQNAPPGLDYERDKRFSKSFKEMVAMCLVKDPKKRPTSEKLLKHSFFKHARSNDYLARSILDDLSPLGDRFRALKEKEANLLLQNNTVSEQLSQREYIKGISGWNFNLEDLKNQAALMDSSDNGLQAEDAVKNMNLNEKTVNFPLDNASEHGTTPTEDGLEELQDLEGAFASAFPMRPLQALKACFDVCEDDVNAISPNSKVQSDLEVASPLQQSSILKDLKFENGNGENLERSTSVPSDIHNLSRQKFSSGSLLPENILSPYRSTMGERDDLRGRAHYERNHSGPVFRQMRDSCNIISAINEGPSEGTGVQCKGRFQITSADISSPKAPHLASCTTNPVRRTPKKSSTHTSSVLPSLQFLLHQNAMQKDQLVKLIKYVEQTSGIFNDTETSDLHFAGGSQVLGASSTERQLQTYAAHLQQSIVKLVEEVQRVNSKNSQLEQQIKALSVKEEREVEDIRAGR